MYYFYNFWWYILPKLSSNYIALLLWWNNYFILCTNKTIQKNSGVPSPVAGFKAIVLFSTQYGRTKNKLCVAVLKGIFQEINQWKAAIFHALQKNEISSHSSLASKGLWLVDTKWTNCSTLWLYISLAVNYRNEFIMYDMSKNFVGQKTYSIVLSLEEGHQSVKLKWFDKNVH